MGILTTPKFARCASARPGLAAVPAPGRDELLRAATLPESAHTTCMCLDSAEASAPDEQGRHLLGVEIGGNSD